MIEQKVLVVWLLMSSTVFTDPAPALPYWHLNVNSKYVIPAYHQHGAQRSLATVGARPQFNKLTELKPMLRYQLHI